MRTYDITETELAALLNAAALAGIRAVKAQNNLAPDPRAWMVQQLALHAEWEAAQAVKNAPVAFSSKDKKIIIFKKGK